MRLCVNEFLFALIQKGEAFQQLMHRAYMFFLLTTMTVTGGVLQDILWTKLKAKARLALSGEKLENSSWFVFCNKGASVLEAWTRQKSGLWVEEILYRLGRES